MGGACSVLTKQKSAEGSELKVKKRFKTFRSFSRKKEAVSDDYLKSKGKKDSGELRLSFSCQFFPSTTPRKSGDAKKSSFLGKAGIAGLERAVEVLDALGSGVANLNSSGVFSGFAVKGSKISVLAFEVANTITRAASLMQSLSEENALHVKQKLFFSEGVQRLVSTDTKVLLSIAAADKREELNLLCREVVRFGNLCKDPQWHNLNRYFAKLDSENAACIPIREEAELKLHELTILAQHTAELYHELNALDRFEQDYRQSREEAESLNLPCKGESLMMLQTEFKHQKKLVMSLKRASLWSRRMEEVIEKLVDIVAFMREKISKVYGNIDVGEVGGDPNNIPERLGAAGLALHYANLINQIDNITTRPSCLPPNTRDSLYHGLPVSVKNALRSSLRRPDSKQKLSILQIKAEMEKILEWLAPMATSTSKMYQGFGWVGEWANTSNSFRKQTAYTGNILRLQTLYHAEKHKTDHYILELVKWLHLLISAAKQRDYALLKPLTLSPASQKWPPIRSATTKCPSIGEKPVKLELSKEERNLLEALSEVQSLPILSKSQRLSSINRRSFKMPWVSCRSNGSSPSSELRGREAELHDDGCDLQSLNRLDLAL